MKPRHFYLTAWAAIALLVLAASLMGCASAPRDANHNAHGGYIPACGDLPPLLGDDC